MAYDFKTLPNAQRTDNKLVYTHTAVPERITISEPSKTNDQMTIVPTSLHPSLEDAVKSCLTGHTKIDAIKNEALIAELESLFTKAAHNGDINTLRLLWSLGYENILSTNTPTSNWDALMWACESDHRDTISYLLGIGFDVKSASFDGQTPLLRAATNGHARLVDTLLSKGANPNAVTMTGDTALISSARNGHYEVVQILLKAGANIDSETASGNFTALALASRFGHETVVQLLLDNRASIEFPSFNAFTPLMFASQNGHVACVQRLLDAKANVNACDAGGRTALVLGAENGHAEIVGVLLRAGANTELENESTYRKIPTAICRASRLGHDRIVGQLLDAGAQCQEEALKIATSKRNIGVIAEFILRGKVDFDPDTKNSEEDIRLDSEVERVGFVPEPGTEDYDMLKAAARQGDASTVERLLQSGTNMVVADIYSEAPLVDAIRSGHLQTVQLIANAIMGKLGTNTHDNQWLINYGSKFGITPLVLAARIGRLDMVKVLLEAGADPSHPESWNSRTALIEAVRNGRHDIAETLIHHNCNMNNGGKSKNALAHACSKNDMPMVQMLITAGAEVSHKASDKAQPLIIAANHGFFEVAEVLINAGADVNAKDQRNNTTAIIAAAKRNDARMISLLVESGADVEGTAWDGWTALAFTARDGFQEASEELSRRGACIDCVVTKGYTPLLLATRNGHLSTVRFLLAAGADITAQTSDGSSALHLSALQGHEDICVFLLEKSIDPTIKDNSGKSASTVATGLGFEHIAATIHSFQLSWEPTAHQQQVRINLQEQDDWSCDEPSLVVPEEPPSALKYDNYSRGQTLDPFFPSSTNNVFLGIKKYIPPSPNDSTVSEPYPIPSNVDLDGWPNDVKTKKYKQDASTSQFEEQKYSTPRSDVIEEPDGPRNVQTIRETCKDLEPALCDECIVMIPPISELETNGLDDSGRKLSEQKLSYWYISASAQNGCPGCKMAMSFLLHHWTPAEMKDGSIFRRVLVSEKDKNKGLKNHQSFMALYDGGAKDSKYSNTRTIHLTNIGYGFEDTSPEQLRDKLLQHDKDVWDFQTLCVAYRVGKSEGPICRFVVYADAGKNISSPSVECVWAFGPALYCHNLNSSCTALTRPLYDGYRSRLTQMILPRNILHLGLGKRTCNLRRLLRLRYRGYDNVKKTMETVKSIVNPPYRQD